MMGEPFAEKSSSPFEKFAPKVPAFLYVNLNGLRPEGGVERCVRQGGPVVEVLVAKDEMRCRCTNSSAGGSVQY